MENLQGRRRTEPHTLWKYEIILRLTLKSRLRALCELSETIHVGPPATANASTLGADTSATTFKGLSLQIAEFFINHPILAMLVLGLIALIGFVLTIDV